MISYRLAALRSFMDDKKVNVFIIKNPVNLHYFSGFRGDSSVLIISHKRSILVTDGRYMEQAAKEAPKFEIVRQEEGLWKKVCETLNEIGLRSIGVEGNYITVNEFNHIKEQASKLRLTPLIPDTIRQVKDETEIANIERACEIADKAFDDIVKFIKPGLREYEVAARLEQTMRQLGSEKPAFDTIVASGIRSSMPHGRATDKVIRAGEFVTMDFGAIYNGYNSDITRTVFVGRPNEKHQRLYSAVLRAQYLGLKTIKAGLLGKDIDAVVRADLEQEGFAQFFSHGLGHGVGLEIHEEPRLSKTSTSEALKSGMIVTDEPGVYIADFGGVRIEDTVLVTDSEARPLTKSPKHLILIRNEE